MKTVRVFTMVMASRLTTGLTVSGVTIVHANEFFRAHGLAELHFGQLHRCVRCSDMTTVSKKYQRGSHVRGCVQPEFIFPRLSD